MLLRHPFVSEVSGGNEPLSITTGAWQRRIEIDRGGLFGLVELLDNNPLVCADEVSLPTPAQTLALIALGPLCLSGLITERPAFITNASATEDEIDRSLCSVGWAQGVNLHVEPQDLGSVLVATAMAVVDTPSDISDIGELFDERFGRSFFVREAGADEWVAELVQNAPFACYRISIAADEPNSLVTVRVMADRDGKCGAAQIVHAMNVMSGFEDSLGIA
jgi:N-acetyl-gamma-glutamylphosphate reductase